MLIDLDATTEERATVPIDADAVFSLREWYAANPPSFSPVEFAWDLHRLFGEEGVDLFADLLFDFDPPDNPARADEYIAAQWAAWTADGRTRPTQYDRLLFDEMGKAHADGWQAPADLEPMFVELATQEMAVAHADRQLRDFRIWTLAESINTEDANAMRPNLSVVPAEPLPDLIQSSGAFVEGFVPPEYLLDRVLQRRFCYSITAQTGVGKTAVAMLLSAHVAEGRALGGLDVAKGTVLYFAGENPTDIQMRWLGLTQEMKMDPRSADVHFVAGAVPLSQIAERITAEVARKGLTLALVVVDTAAAYFEGDDENSNSQAADHAKRMRSLTMLPGGPSVVILCHPTKRAAEDDLIPRGGGAFLAEVDGNVALQKRESLIVASAQGKFRGADFAPLSFELRAVTHPTLKDSRRRDIWTVVASPLTDTGKQQIEAAARRHEDGLLRAIEKHPGASLRDLATALRWLDKAGKPVAERVRRAAEVLAREKLILKHRGAWQLTPKGQKELNSLDMPATGSNYLLSPVTPLVTAPRPLQPLPPRS